ncbi:hypothetical protein [Lysinibacillus fusiformis]|uniref:hypothetical protein n=1 Tax=Lysinibacillus fusiformis TaxID=28031 RepID=UPI0011A1E047|nr:hypothetical protein [Lysinibacillus fusiformis]
MKTSIKPGYFDPYIYKKLQEDIWLLPRVKEIADIEAKYFNGEYQQTLLFPYIEPIFERYLEGKKRDLERTKELIDHLVLDELFYRIEVLQEYIGIDEKEKQQWFAQLREVYNLPLEYEFERADI